MFPFTFIIWKNFSFLEKALQLVSFLFILLVSKVINVTVIIGIHTNYGINIVRKNLQKW